MKKILGYIMIIGVGSLLFRQYLNAKQAAPKQIKTKK